MKGELVLSIVTATLKVIQSLSAESYILKSLNTTNNDLADGIRFFYDGFFFKYHKTGFILSAAQQEFDVKFLDLKTSLLSNHQNKINHIFSIENYAYIKTTPNMIRNTAIVLIDTYKSFTMFEKALTSNRFNLHGYFLFVLIKGLWKEHEMQNFISIVWTKGITNFNIIYKSSDEIIVSSIQPFNSDSCFDLRLRQLNTYKEGSFLNNTNSILFPKGKIFTL